MRELQARLSLPQHIDGRTELVDDAHRQYTSGWTEFVAAAAAVRITTTDELAGDAERTKQLVGDYSDLVDHL